MAAIMVGNWWALALRGGVAILFAVVALVWPGITALTLLTLFGVYAFLDGIFALIAGLRAARRHGRSGALLLEGILNILLGLVIFIWPAPALIAFVYLIAIWAIVTGIVLIAAGIGLIRHSGEWLLLLGGVVSVLLGVILLFQPAAGVVALSWWFAIYALLFGIALVAAAFRLRYHPV